MYKCCGHCDPADKWHASQGANSHGEPCNYSMWCEGKQKVSAMAGGA